MNQKRNWQNGDEWRTLAYKFYRDSRTYRYILALNPSFDIRSIPSPGVVVNVSGDLGPGINQPGGASIPGTLQQVGLNLNLQSGSNDSPVSVQNGIFPYDSTALYAERLGLYTAAALLASDRTNGFALDSPQATGDTQRL